MKTRTLFRLKGRWLVALAASVFVSISSVSAGAPLQFAQQAYLKAFNSRALDQFGYSVAISGDTMVVGAPAFEGEDNSGAAYVFVRSGTDWTEQACLKPGSLDIYAFGISVAICTNTIVVGARVAAPPGDPVPWVDGSAFVFVRDGTNWSQQEILQPANFNNNFGTSVSVCGNIAVVGADGDSTSGFNSGAAYVFVRSGTNWTEEAYLNAPNAEPDDRFGLSVSVSGETVVVGAYGEDSGATGVNGSQTNHPGFGDSGAAYVFTRNGTTWPQQAYLKASDTSIDDLFGFSVAVSGDTAVIGAKGEASNATGVQNTSQRTAGQDDDHAPEAGAAYVFVRTGTNWSQQAYLKAFNAEFRDYFGSAVAVSGDTVVIGASGEDSSASGVNGNQGNNSAFNSGAAYTFSRSGTNWSSQAYLKASNPEGSSLQFAEGDYFGYAVAVSGETILSGAPFEDSNATGANGNQSNNDANDSGAAYVFVESNVVSGPTVPEYIITTFAGIGEAGFSGDGGAATNATLNFPESVAVDGAGNVYIADTSNDRVRRVGSNGIITPFAGNGTRGFSGDGGAATNAQFGSLQFSPHLRVAVDGAGNVYIADWGNHRVRRVGTNGIITPFAGNGTPGFSGDGGAATNAQFGSPQFGSHLELAVDSVGNLYIADSYNSRVRRVGTDGIITTIAGNGMPGFAGDGGFATNARLGFTRGLAADSDGNVFFSGDARVRRIGANGIITTLAGTGTLGFSGDGGLATNATLNFPEGVAVDRAGNVYIADSSNYRIRRVDTNGVIATVAGNGQRGTLGDGGPALFAQLMNVSGLAVNSDGNVFLAGRDDNRIRRLSPTGRNLALAPDYFSVPASGSTFDFGDVTGMGGGSITFFIGNSTNATIDLRIESYEISGDLYVPGSIVLTADPFLVFPRIVPPGFSGDPPAQPAQMTLTWTWTEGDYLELDATLRVFSNDPVTPVASYRLRGSSRVTGTVVFPIPLEGTRGEASEEETGARKIVLNGTRTATFTLAANAARNLIAEIPSFLGGGSVTLSNFNGSFTVSLHPIPNDTNRAFIRVESGSFTAPTFRLPSGLNTGPNQLTFGPPEQSGGILYLTNGSYTAYATARIVNNLIPDGVTVRGNYSGIYNAETGAVSLQSESRDLIQRSDRMLFSNSTNGFWLTWANTNALEQATSILGPWQTVSNAASPYSVITTNLQQFFRLRSASP